jgi:hypothetical protein
MTYFHFNKRGFLTSQAVRIRVNPDGLVVKFIKYSLVRIRSRFSATLIKRVKHNNEPTKLELLNNSGENNNYFQAPHTVNFLKYRFLLLIQAF